MDFAPILVEQRKAAMKAAGLWRDRTIEPALQRALRECPDKIAVVDYRQGRDEPLRLTYRELDDRVDRIARGLVTSGVGPGDVVSFQLPNWWEFIALWLACGRIGACANPVMPIFRERELEFMLGLAESKVFVVPKSFRNFDHEVMARDLLSRLPTLQRVVVIGGEGEDAFEQALLGVDTPPLSHRGIEPDEVMLLLYTSGTTGEPKGVMHTYNTVYASIDPYVEMMHLGKEDFILGASPFAHATGFFYLAMMPIELNATTVLLDVWDPKRALEIIRRERITFSMAAAVFVSDMCHAVEQGAAPPETLRCFVSAGAPIPSVLIERAHRLLGMTLCSAWGMTECGAATLTEPERALEKSAISDGRPIRGVEVKIVDGQGTPLPTGQTGRLLIRGSVLFGGYLKRPHLNNVDAEGWFDTGDLAFADDEGYIRINGRSKDIIIRGGENLPVMEIENILYAHPAIAACAVVGYPDERLGERACAFVILKPGTSFDFAEMVRWFESKQTARQYIPERLEIVENMPTTPSGKIQKFKLREWAKERVNAKEA